MALPWARLDVTIGTNDKILELLGSEDDGRGVAFSYVCCIAYGVANGTDGFVPYAALPFVHASRHDMEAMVAVGLLAPHPRGWVVINFTERQQSSGATAQLTLDKKRAGAKGNCVRHHGADCGCWKARLA